MNEDRPIQERVRNRRGRLPHHFRELLHKLLFHTHRGASRPDFLRQAAEILLEFSGCDLLEIRIDEGGKSYRCRGKLGDGGALDFTCESSSEASAWPLPVQNVPGPGTQTEAVIEAVLQGKLAAAAPFITRSGTFWTGDAARPILLRELRGDKPTSRTVVLGGEFQSLAIIPFPINGGSAGILHLGSRRRDFFTKDDIQFYEALAESLGVALSHQGAQWALRERVKELTCLYGVAQAAQTPGRTIEELLQDVVRLIPPGWQYPEITRARIVLDGRAFATEGFEDGFQKMSAPLLVNNESRGAIEVVYAEERPEIDEGPFLKEERSLLNAVAETLGMALSSERARWALRERIKELTCLHGIANIAQKSDLSLDQLLSEIVELLPPAWQYPEITSARITLDGNLFPTKGFREHVNRLSAGIRTSGSLRGVVEVVYLEDRPEAGEGMFLREERSLIDEVARQLGLIVERRETEQERARLQQQLRHADRLATIGQLAAGAAHELNEPLGSILGFAQLAKSSPKLPVQAGRDIDRIINAALHAREVIKKLMIFARQIPTRKSRCSLNNLVREGLYFLESRCAREGISLVRQLDEGLPEITADATQLHQVLVNLVVNAIQAMPDGGTLTIRTRMEGEFISLTVEDTGIGMNEEILRHLFIPFFTTKDVGQGTGLGLSVVHGIVTSHGGTIQVESQEGKGSRFRVRLPVAEPPNPKEGN